MTTHFKRITPTLVAAVLCTTLISQTTLLSQPAASPPAKNVFEAMREAGTSPDAIEPMLTTLYKHRLELEIQRVGISTRIDAIERAIQERKSKRSEWQKAQIEIKLVEIDEAKMLLKNRVVELQNAKALVEKGLTEVHELQAAEVAIEMAKALIRKKEIELSSIAASDIKHLNDLLVDASIDQSEIEARYAHVGKRLAVLQGLSNRFKQLRNGVAEQP